MIKGFKILKFEDVEEGLTDYHLHGARPGVFLGFENMRKFYSMREEGVTDWTGLPQSGKTELLLECLFNTSIQYGWKHLLNVPDIGKSIEVMAILIHKYTGKTFENYPNKIDIKTAFNACPWIFEHFKILEKQDPKAKVTPMQYWEAACQNKKELGIQTATIDSWKDLHHPYADHGGTYAMYLSHVLPARNLMSEMNNLHFHTVVHPKTPRRDRNGLLIHPYFDDMEGGAQWNNSGKTIISVHRDSPQSVIARCKILKSKPRSVGMRGDFDLMFDPVTSRYYELDIENGGHKLYARDNYKKLEKSKQQELVLVEAPEEPSQPVTIYKEGDDLPF